jgi:hypothetical protein
MKRTFKDKTTVGQIPNAKIYEGLLDYARSKGVPIYSGSGGDEYDEFPNITFSSVELCGNCSTFGAEEKEWISIDQFFEYCDNWKQSLIKLNDNYNAKINRDKQTIEVGCQTISFAAVEQLYKAIHS